MINAGFVDFLFTGAAILPEMLIITGHIGEGLLLLIPLMIVACLVGMYRSLQRMNRPARQLWNATQE